MHSLPLGIMDCKSLSPKMRYPIKKSKTHLSKIKSNKQLSPLNSGESLFTSNLAHIQPSNTNISSTRLSLKLKPLFIATSTKKKIIQLKSKFLPVVNIIKSPKKLGEHLLPLKSDEAISVFSEVLCDYEIGEMREFKWIYYLGLKANKVQPVVNGDNNFGFDDKNTNLVIVCGDHIAYQYQIIEILGFGTFAQVVKCRDHKHNRDVAIKIIKSHSRFQSQAQVELKILIFLKKEAERNKQYCSFVNILSHFKFREHLCIVFELLSYSLYDLLSANSFKGFSTSLVKRFTKQLLEILSLLKQSDIIHCDLKPENVVLINPAESTLKLIDFGSSCFSDEKIYYYIQSRIYRAPEIILGVPYTSAIDMWSLGCIIAELLTGSPLFIGENEEDQLNAIIEILGNPPVALIEAGLKSKKFFGAKGKLKSAATPTGRVRIPGSIRLEEVIRAGDSRFFDFLKSKLYVECLEWSPEKRITPENALKHVWLNGISTGQLRG